jgi:competence protein ComEC
MKRFGYTLLMIVNKTFIKYSGIIFIALSIITYSLKNSYTEETITTKYLMVAFLDIGQGDSIYIRTPNGNDVIIDGGPDDSILQKINKVLPSFDKDIDLMIATHPDKDHIAGLTYLFKEYQIKNFLHSEISSGTMFDRELQKQAHDETGLDQIIARRGQRYILDTENGIYLDILFPDQNTSDFKDTNDASIVARLVYGTTSFLLTGDSPISVEDYLAHHDTSLLKNNVLKLGHHGSKTSSGDLYLDTVKPDYAIVSAGKNNRYHHPNPETVERVTDRTIPILSTIDLGTIIMESDGIHVWKK